MKSILFISLMNGDPWGGSEELWFQTAMFAITNGYKVDCLVYDQENKKPRLQPLVAAGAKIWYIPNEGKLERSLSEKVQFKITKKFKIPQLLDSINFKAYDHVIISQGEFEVSLSVWKNLWKRLGNYSLLFHNYKETQELKAKRLGRIRDWTNNATVNLFASRRICIVLEQLMKSKIRNAEILINPITLIPPATPKPWAPLKNGNYVFVELAALDVRRKAQDNLIIALSAPQWRNRNWELHLFGEGIDREDLETLIIQRGLQDRVFLRGHTREVEQALTEAHLVCQMTFIDAMPISVVEGMACARPVLVSTIGDMPYWVTEGVNGFVSKDATIDSMEQTLEKAWAVRDQWEQMGRESFKIFRDKFPENVNQYFLDQVQRKISNPFDH
jgi:glycosyltransferase involved in cell wall biosynthesis